MTQEYKDYEVGVEVCVFFELQKLKSEPMSVHLKIGVETSTPGKLPFSGQVA